MKLSIETYFLRKRFNDKTAIKMIGDAGFDAFDYSFYYEGNNEYIDLASDDYANQAQQLRNYADSLGIECNQAHAPFRFEYTDTMDMQNDAYRTIVRSIHAAAILGAKNIIVHAKSRIPIYEDMLEYNYKYYKSLEKYCEQYGICVSIENLFTGRLEPVFGNPYLMMKLIDKLDSPWFNVCTDVGHASITGFEPQDVISAFKGDVLKSLHIHDNCYKRDDHTLPYLGKINWVEIAKALREINYSGDFTYEIASFFTKFPDELLPEALRLAEKTGRYLISLIK